MKLIDTNVFIYASGRNHPLKAACAGVYQMILESPNAFVIDSEVLQEILHVYTSRAETRRGVEMVRNLLVLFPRPLPVTERELLQACTLLEKYPGLSARDALHAGVIMIHSLGGIISTDSDFERIQECSRFRLG